MTTRPLPHGHHLRALDARDLPALLALHAAVMRALPDPGLFRLFGGPERFLSDHLGARGESLGAFAGERLVGYGSVTRPAAGDLDNYARDLGWTPERAGRVADPANWRVAKSIFVAKDAATARAYATDPDGPYVYYYRSLFTKLKRSGRIELFKTRRDQPDEEVTLEAICDKLIIWGTPESVADQLLSFQDEVGKFGTLLYAGKDWRDRELARQSMILMAEKVIPRVNTGAARQSNAAE